MFRIRKYKFEELLNLSKSEAVKSARNFEKISPCWVIVQMRFNVSNCKMWHIRAIKDKS